MFKHLFDFSYKRNFVEAVGFYIAYLLLILLFSMLFGALIGLVTGNQNNYQLGVKIGNIIAIIATLSLSFLILNKKHLMSNFGYLLIALLSGLLAIFAGGLLGLIPSAFLSTRKK